MVQQKTLSFQPPYSYCRHHDGRIRTIDMTPTRRKRKAATPDPSILTLIDLPDNCLAHTAEYLSVFDLLRLDGTCHLLHDQTVTSEFQRRYQRIPEGRRPPEYRDNVRQTVIAFEMSRSFSMRIANQCLDHRNRRCRGCSYPDLTDIGYNSQDFNVHERNFFVLLTTSCAANDQQHQISEKTDSSVIWEGFLPPYLHNEEGPVAHYCEQHPEENGVEALQEFVRYFLDPALFQLHLKLHPICCLTEDQILDENLHVTVVDFAFSIIPQLPPQQKLYYSSQGFQKRVHPGELASDSAQPERYQGALHLFKDEFVDTHNMFGDYATGFFFWDSPTHHITSLSVVHIEDNQILHEESEDDADDDVDEDDHDADEDDPGEQYHRSLQLGVGYR